MSGVPQRITRQSGPSTKRWLKRVLARLLRREAKRIDPDRDLKPKRRFTGWD